MCAGAESGAGTLRPRRAPPRPLSGVANKLSNACVGVRPFTLHAPPQRSPTARLGPASFLIVFMLKPLLARSGRTPLAAHCTSRRTAFIRPFFFFPTRPPDFISSRPHRLGLGKMYGAWLERSPRQGIYARRKSRPKSTWCARRGDGQQ